MLRARIWKKMQERRGEDDRTEAGKGSEQGQASREETAEDGGDSGNKAPA